MWGGLLGSGRAKRYAERDGGGQSLRDGDRTALPAARGGGTSAVRAGFDLGRRSLLRRLALLPRTPRRDEPVREHGGQVDERRRNGERDAEPAHERVAERDPDGVG